MKHDVGDFDIAFANEAMAKANAIAGSESETQRYIKPAREAGERLYGKDDRDYFLGDLKTVPGYRE